MNTTSWIMWGLGLTCVAGMVHSAGPDVSEPIAATYAALPALLIGAAGQYCLWRGLRSGMGDLWGGLTARKYREDKTGKPGRGEEPAAQGEPPSDFDADAAFARYMEQRSARADEPAVVPQPEADLTAPTPRPALSPRPAAARGFGRKMV